MSDMNNIGIYIHIPFCASKCPYCDFYSFRSDEETRAKYTAAVIRELHSAAGKYGRTADTLYLGGGTPSLLGGDTLTDIIEAAKRDFCIDSGAEITVECNPHSLENGIFEKLKAAGVSRISLGLQSANDSERKRLGRRADRSEIESVIKSIKSAGIDNISLDVMLGIPDGNTDSLKSTLDFCISQDVNHISGYILKIEEGTPFEKLQETLSLPDDDAVSDMYLFMCDYLDSHGYKQYEISNFAKRGSESCHNLKYWNCEEYLGIGAAAHSFIDGKRFYYPRSAEGFINGISPEADGEGGDFGEYAMLRLRLTDGLDEGELEKKFGISIPDNMRKKAEKYTADGYLVSDGQGIRLTRKGFLVSNTIISELIY